jgi:hypothetical protein
MSVYTNHGNTTAAKRNSVRKLKLTERYCPILRRIVPKNQTSTAAQVTEELDIILEDTVSTKLFRNPIYTVELPLLTSDYRK